MLRHYSRWLFGAIAASLAAIGLANWLIDPLCVYRRADAGPLAQFKSRAIDRIGKAETARSLPLDAVLIGDSRVLRGFDPRHPALAAYGRSYNLGISAGSIYETARILDLCLDRHPPKVVLWSFAPELIESDMPLRTNFDFDLSRLNPRLDPVLYHAHNLWGRDVLKASFTVVKQRWRGRSADICDGFAPDRKSDSHPQETFAKWLPTAHPPLRSDVSRADVASSLQRIAGCLDRAQSQGTQVFLLFPPVHAAYLEGMAEIGLWEHYENGKRHLVELAARQNRAAPRQSAIMVWDFSGFTGLVAEPPPRPGSNHPMMWYLDPLHFRETLGNIVLDRIFDHTQYHAEFGVVLTPETIETQLLSRRSDRARYRRECRDVIQLVRDPTGTLR
jgi:hypothetical protein